MNAVIIDIKGRSAAAMCENGSIVRIPDANYTVGQVMELHEIRHRRAPSLRKIGTVAAAAALILGIGTGTAYATPYGTVTLDTDSAIEYTINRFDRVLRVKALNEEGEAVLETLDVDTIRFRPVEQAIEATFSRQESGDKSPIQIVTKTKNAQHTERLQEHLRHSVRTESLPPIPDGTPGLPDIGFSREASTHDRDTREHIGVFHPDSVPEERENAERPEETVPVDEFRKPAGEESDRNNPSDFSDDYTIPEQPKSPPYDAMDTSHGHATETFSPAEPDGGFSLPDFAPTGGPELGGPPPAP